MRNQIKNEFEDPKNYRTRKVITFSTVLPILILGIGSIGASLLVSPLAPTMPHADSFSLSLVFLAQYRDSET